MSLEIFINNKSWTILGRQKNFLQSIIDVEFADTNRELIAIVNGVLIPKKGWRTYKLKDYDRITVEVKGKA